MDGEQLDADVRERIAHLEGGNSGSDRSDPAPVHVGILCTLVIMVLAPIVVSLVERPEPSAPAEPIAHPPRLETR
jgi:hypothetical protein